MQLAGIHHLTAVTAQASRNHEFYTRTLGLRLVKNSVNQDDVSAYHLFYADGKANPGTDLTFFDFPAAGFLVLSLITPVDDFREGICRLLRRIEVLT